jgi:FkbM family methyltransferase
MQVDLRKSWTVSFLRTWHGRMSTMSLLRFWNYLFFEQGAADPRGLLQLRMSPPVCTNVLLRKHKSDIATFEEIFNDGIYRSIIQHIPDITSLIDLGANIGLASLYFASHYCNCRVFAVEPHPETYNLLTRNLQSLIAAGRCKTLEAAVWDRAGVKLVPSGEEPDSFSSFAVIESRSGESRNSPIESFTMDQVLEMSGFSTVDLLKVDIEGAERQLLRGDVSWLDRVSALAIEFHGASRKDSGFDEKIAAHGLEIVEETRHTTLACRNALGRGASVCGYSR